MLIKSCWFDKLMLQVSLKCTPIMSILVKHCMSRDFKYSSQLFSIALICLFNFGNISTSKKISHKKLKWNKKYRFVKREKSCTPSLSLNHLKVETQTFTKINNDLNNFRNYFLCYWYEFNGMKNRSHKNRMNIFSNLQLIFKMESFPTGI